LRLIVGLGNPGAAYAQTRHNAGMWVVERAAARWSARLVRRGAVQRASVRHGSQEIELVGTLDFMNVTGAPLKGLLREYQLSLDDLILVHDDLDLEPGRLRIKQAGGHGGHNGLKSVIDALGTSQFIRVKIGIGRPAPGQDSADYVLEMIHRGIGAAMNQFNIREREDSDQ
jgi:peptidyl-tRNA hydrolase, PTH1 family